MDSLTHIVLGACVGEAVAGKQLGKKAMWLGALANSLPDIDFIAGFWMDTDDELLAHRGFTHSILFALLVTIFMALAMKRWSHLKKITFKKWEWFFGIEISLHLFLDAFNNYGVGWFEPFSPYRVSFNAVYVADPFFSVWPGIAFAALLLLKAHYPKRMWLVKRCLGISTVYLMYCCINKINTDTKVREALATQNISHEKYFTTPAPLNNWLWYIVAGNDSGFHVGFRSVFDRKKEVEFHFFPRNDSLLSPVRDHEDLQHLIRFSQGFYTAEKWNDTLVFNDLRFGQIVGWHNPEEKFVFHYFLQHPNDNELVVQRGRFAKWDWETTKSLIKRISGN